MSALRLATLSSCILLLAPAALGQSNVLSGMQSDCRSGRHYRSGKTGANERAQPRGPHPPSGEAAATCRISQSLESLRQTKMAYRRGISPRDSASARSRNSASHFFGSGAFGAVRFANPG